MSLPGIGETYRFGSFELASGTGELRKNGLRLKLQDQPVRVLILLLENAGEVVTREQIQKRLWADEVHVDYENAINSAVRKLREVLIDSSDNPRFVETLPKRGYRFVAPVSRVESAAAPAEVAPVEAAPVEATIERAKPRRTLFAVAGIACLLAIGGVALWYYGRAQPEAPLTAVPFTSYPGYEGSPDFSPDGNQVVFQWNGEKSDNYDIYVKLIGSGRPLRLTTDPAFDGSPAWSPDGRSIAFRRVLPDGNTTIFLVPALGGTEREVARLGKTRFSFIGGWSPDGRRLLVSWSGKASEPSRLFWLSVDTGEKRWLTSPSPATPGDEWCRISPDGQSIAFMRVAAWGNTNSVVGDLYTLPMTPDLAPKGEPKRLTFDNAGGGQIAWTAGSREIVFSSNRDGSVALWKISVSGAEKPRRMEVGENAYFPAISPRANRLMYTQQVVGDINVWRLDLSKPAAPPVSLIASTHLDASAHYSPDGRRIAFRSDRTGADEIWVCDADGSNEVQLTTRGHSGSPHSGSPHWSPDSRQIVFDSMVDGVWQILEVSSQGGQPRQLTSGSANVRPSWSHDGKWIYFTSSRTGRYEVWKAPAGGGAAVQLSKNGGNDPLEAEDGTGVFYNRVNTILKSAPDGSGESRVLDGVNDEVTNMAVTGAGIYYRDAQLPRTVRFFNFSTGMSRLILTTEKPSAEVSVSPDGHWLLYRQIDTQPGGDLMLVENFR